MFVLNFQLKREMFGFKSSFSKYQRSSLSNKEDNYIGCCEANKMIISELRYGFQVLKLWNTVFFKLIIKLRSLIEMLKNTQKSPENIKINIHVVTTKN